mgnify:CR=1 FL=1
MVNLVQKQNSKYCSGKVYKGEQNSGDSYLSGIVDISASKFVSAAIDVNGDIYRWGANEYGQLGIGNTTEKYVPVRLLNHQMI